MFAIVCTEDMKPDGIGQLEYMENWEKHHQRHFFLVLEVFVLFEKREQVTDVLGQRDLSILPVANAPV